VLSGRPAPWTRAGRALAQRELWGISGPGDLIPPRATTAMGTGRPDVNADTAMRNSAVWACLRLRADLISTLPVSVARDLGDGTFMPVAKPQVLITPGGPTVRYCEWMFSSQWDLDRIGNMVGIIRAWDGNGFPSLIELQPTRSVVIKTEGTRITSYRIADKSYPPEQIWHEKQYTIPGLPVGLSPVAYAAYTLGRWASVEQFAASWFAGGGVPRARLKNVAKKIVGKESTIIKEAWNAAIAAGEPFVFGSDWEYDLIQAEQSSDAWLQSNDATTLDVARFFGCPADLIDAAVQTGTSITYANVTQRNLQFLVMHLGPVVTRREEALTTLTAAPRIVRLDTDALLRMDPLSRAQMIKTMIDSRTITPSEARVEEGRQPLTQADKDEFNELFPPKSAAPAAPKAALPAPAEGGGPGAPGA
jgi:HK97 family phage portal protein